MRVQRTIAEQIMWMRGVTTIPGTKRGKYKPFLEQPFTKGYSGWRPGAQVMYFKVDNPKNPWLKVDKDLLGKPIYVLVPTYPENFSKIKI